MKKKHYLIFVLRDSANNGKLMNIKNTLTLCSVSVVLNDCIYSSPREQTLHLRIIIESA